MKRRAGRYGKIAKPVIDGHRFDSGREGQRYQELMLLVRAGAIHSLEIHPRIKIIIGGIPIKLRSDRYPNGRQLTYVADFRYIDSKTNQVVVEDVKMASGHRTDTYRLKRALLDAMGIEILET